MEIRVEQAQGRTAVTVFHIVGSIHLGNAEHLETQARAAIAAGSRNIVFDLTDVSTMTSAGLRVLHLLYKLLGSNASQKESDVRRSKSDAGTTKSEHLKLVNPSPSLLRVLNIAGFDMFLEIHDTVSDAVASF